MNWDRLRDNTGGRRDTETEMEKEGRQEKGQEEKKKKDDHQAPLLATAAASSASVDAVHTSEFEHSEAKSKKSPKMKP